MRESLISILKKATVNNKKPKFTNYLDIINEMIDLSAPRSVDKLAVERTVLEVLT